MWRSKCQSKFRFIRFYASADKSIGRQGDFRIKYFHDLVVNIKVESKVLVGSDLIGAVIGIKAAHRIFNQRRNLGDIKDPFYFPVDHIGGVNFYSSYFSVKCRSNVKVSKMVIIVLIFIRRIEHIDLAFKIIKVGALHVHDHISLKHRDTIPLHQIQSCKIGVSDRSFKIIHICAGREICESVELHS